MNFNLSSDGATTTSPSFATDEFSSYNEDIFGTLVESCFKTIDTSQIKFHSREQQFSTFTLDDFVEQNTFDLTDHDINHKPRSCGVPTLEKWENSNLGMMLNTIETPMDGIKELANRNSLMPEIENDTFFPNGLFKDLGTRKNDAWSSTTKNVYSFIKKEVEEDIIKLREAESLFTSTNEGVFAATENSIDFQCFSEPEFQIEEMAAKPNYTYELNADLGVVSCKSIKPSFTLNSISSKTANAKLSHLPKEESLNISKSSRSRFTKGSKNKICVQREFKYNGLNVETSLEQSNQLINVAKNEEPYNFQDLLSNKLLELKINKEHSICCIKRNYHIRKNLDPVIDLYKNVGYEVNPKFHISRPYEPQYVRFEIDETNGLPFNETRCGLCPYCPNLNFKNLKTSTYSQHLALTHGVYTDNYLTPNPLYYGIYIIKKTNTHRRTKAHEHERCGVVCPCCYAVVGTECSKTTASSKPLNNYMRHFKEYHRQSKGKLDPMKFFNKVVRVG